LGVGMKGRKSWRELLRICPMMNESGS